jgi:hypothetical protein
MQLCKQRLDFQVFGGGRVECSATPWNAPGAGGLLPPPAPDARTCLSGFHSGDFQNSRHFYLRPAAYE